MLGRVLRETIYMMKWDSKCWAGDCSPTAVQAGRASWAEESGWFSVTLRRRKSTLVLIVYAGSLKWVLKCWCHCSRQNYVFTIVMSHRLLLRTSLYWGPGRSVSCRWHLWSLSLSTENRKTSLFKSMSLQCHLSDVNGEVKYCSSQSQNWVAVLYWGRSLI